MCVENTCVCVRVRACVSDLIDVPISRLTAFLSREGQQCILGARGLSIMHVWRHFLFLETVAYWGSAIQSRHVEESGKSARPVT